MDEQREDWAMTSGKLTSEFKVAQESGKKGTRNVWIGAGLAALTGAGAYLQENGATDGSGAAWIVAVGGLILMIVGALQETWAPAKYVDGRGKVKEAAVRRSTAGKDVLPLLLVLCLGFAAIAPAASVTSGTLRVSTWSSASEEVENFVTILDWSSDAGGNVVADDQVIEEGMITKIVFIDGAAAPTASYDVTLLDPWGVDTLNGGGANVGSSPATSVLDPPLPVFGLHDLRVTNAGASKSGRMLLFMRR